MVENYDLYTKVLREQLIPATGCTEPIALAYGAAMGRGILGELPEKIVAYISGSIIKNVKSVIVPGTGRKKGIEVAIAAGIVAGKENVGLEVLADAPENTDELIEQYLKDCPVIVKLSDSDFIFDIWLKMESKNHRAEVRIAGHHTNVILKKKDDVVLLERDFSSEITDVNTEEALHIQDILEYAKTCKLEDVEPVIMRQIECNTAISKEGLSGKWGAQIGKILLSSSESPGVELRAKAAAAAGSDARMSGCEMPVVINSGSGNQGMTIALPIVEYAKELNADHETLIRSLVLANLVAIRIKQSIGYLSAYCGAVCAGCGAAAGVAYMNGHDRSVIEHTIVNGLAILSGTICDGAKPSCAAKIAMSVEAGLLGYKMAISGQEFVHGEGIVKKGIENTIEEVGTLSREGMNHTNEVILGIMLDK